MFNPRNAISIQCNVLHPDSWKIAEVDYPVGNDLLTDIAYVFPAPNNGKSVFPITAQLFQGKEPLCSLLSLWRKLSVRTPIEENQTYCKIPCAEDHKLIINWLDQYGSPYTIFGDSQTSELKILDREHASFRYTKFITDLYNLSLSYNAIKNKQPHYSKWPMFFYSDGNELMLIAHNLFGVAYTQMLFSALSSNDPVKICERCGDVFIAQRKNARLCGNCFNHRSTYFYQKKRSTDNYGKETR